MVTDFFSNSELPLLGINFRSKLLPLLCIALTICYRPILLAVIRVIPEFTDEYLPPILVTSLFPIVCYNVFKLWLLDFFAQSFICMNIKPLFDFFDLSISIQLLDLVKAVYDTLKLLFSDTRHVNRSLGLKPFAVFYRELVILICEIEVDVLFKHARDLFHIARGFSNFVYVLITKLYIDNWHRGRHRWHN